jgi:hypothetical protein
VLSLSIVAVLLLAATGAAVRAGFSRSMLMLSVSVLEGLGLILLGLPGAAFLEALAPVMQRSGLPPVSADAAWPSAIAMSIAWPIALWPAYGAARRAPAGQLQRGCVALSVLGVTSLLIGVSIYYFLAT